MSENKHTPEPWAVKGATIRTADGIGIDVIATMQVSNQPFWDEDARRIVACVNACAGCATEFLETAPVGFFNSTYGHPKYLEEIIKQRDDLLAALGSGGRHCNDDTPQPDRVAELEAALKVVSVLLHEYKMGNVYKNKFVEEAIAKIEGVLKHA